MSAESRRLAVRQAAEAVNRTPQTIRRWERAGVIPPARRDIYGRRFYTPADVSALKRTIYPDDSPSAA